MELKEGMYIRTKITDNCNCVYIRQITEIETDVEKAYRNQICIDEDVIDGWGDDRIWVDVEDISKASNNIIDLIEEGDYVNGHKVLEIYKDRIKFGEDGLVLARRSNYDNYYLYLEDIKSIVTKEQFESMQYIVEE